MQAAPTACTTLRSWNALTKGSSVVALRPRSRSSGVARSGGCEASGKHAGASAVTALTAALTTSMPAATNMFSCAGCMAETTSYNIHSAKRLAMGDRVLWVPANPSSLDCTHHAEAPILSVGSAPRAVGSVTQTHSSHPSLQVLLCGTMLGVHLGLHNLPVDARYHIASSWFGMLQFCRSYVPLQGDY